LHHVHDDHLEVHEFEKLQTGESDRSRTDDQHRFAGLWIAAIDRMKPDCQCFDQGQLIIAQLIADVQFAGGHDP
jgi:hypothetical protein